MKQKNQVKSEFALRGETISGWAERNGYSKRTVYAVLNGQVKGTRGITHEIAVKLGMKDSADPRS